MSGIIDCLIALGCGSINRFALETEKFPERLTASFLGQTDNKYGNEHSRNEKGSHKSLFLGALQIKFKLSRTHAKRDIIRFAKVGKVEDGMKEWEKIRKMSSQRKQKSECMHVAEKA